MLYTVSSIRSNITDDYLMIIEFVKTENSYEFTKVIVGMKKWGYNGKPVDCVIMTTSIVLLFSVSA